MRKLILTAAVLLSTLLVEAKETYGSTQDGSLTSLVATPMESHVLLSWTTTATGIEVYELERSKNGVEFSSMTRVEPGSVNTEFMETDFSPLEGMSYYRIKVIDAEGNISFSNAVPVKYQAGSPVTPSASKTASTEKSGPVLIVVRNNSGEEYYSKVEISSDTDPMLAKDLEERLAAGTYTVVSSSVQEYYSRKIVVK